MNSSSLISQNKIRTYNLSSVKNVIILDSGLMVVTSSIEHYAITASDYW